MYHYIIKSIKRQRSRSILVILVNCVLAVLLNLYFGLIGSYRTQLSDLAANTPVKCTITNPDGTLEVGIAVSSEILRGLQEGERSTSRFWDVMRNCSHPLRSRCICWRKVRRDVDFTDKLLYTAIGISEDKIRERPGDWHEI